MAERNYKKEYRKFHSSKPAKQARARRNASRRKAVAAGQVKKGDGKDVHHPAGNARGRTVVTSKSKNRADGARRGARKRK